jgi:putative flippase GtrA
VTNSVVDAPERPVRHEPRWRRWASVLRHHPLPRYLVFAGLGFLVDLSLLALLHHYTSLPSAATVTIAFWLTYTLNFALNRRLAFHAGDRSLKRQLVRFLPQVVGDFVLTLTAVVALQEAGLGLTLARVVAGGTNLIFNYILYRWWTFARR